MSLDPRSFRQALGAFASGVTVITAIDPASGAPVGVTVSAFASLSLQPPLVLFCLGRDGSCLAAIEAAGRCGINILAEPQRDLSNRFAGPVGARWTDQSWSPLPGGAPALPGCLVTLDCRLVRTEPGGDHLIFIVEVEGIHPGGGERPLLHHRGAYLDLAP